MSEDDFLNTQQEWDEAEFEFLTSEDDYIENRDEQIYRGELNQRVKEHERGIKKTKQDIKNIRLQQKLMDILKKLRRSYHIPYQSNVQTAKTLCETEKEARDKNIYQTTTFTFKLFYILSIVIFGFFLQLLCYKLPLLATCLIVPFLIGLFPIKNIIYLPKPSKRICDICDRIENFIWKKDILDEDVIEMNKLLYNEHHLINKGVLSKMLNVVIILIILYVSITIDIFPHKS